MLVYRGTLNIKANYIHGAGFKQNEFKYEPDTLLFFFFSLLLKTG